MTLVITECENKSNRQGYLTNHTVSASSGRREYRYTMQCNLLYLRQLVHQVYPIISEIHEGPEDPPDTHR